MKSEKIDEYIDQFPEDVKKILEKIRSIINNSVPDANEAFSYQIPTFQYENKNMVHFAAYNDHIGLYPTPSGIAKFKKELKVYKPAKGSVKFPLDQEIPYKIIEEIVKYRKSEIESK